MLLLPQRALKRSVIPVLSKVITMTITMMLMTMMSVLMIIMIQITHVTKTVNIKIIKRSKTS